jgi:hypothetical protein
VGAGFYSFSGGIQEAAAGGADKVVSEAVSSLAGLPSAPESSGAMAWGPCKRSGGAKLQVRLNPVLAIADCGHATGK